MTKSQYTPYNPYVFQFVAGINAGFIGVVYVTEKITGNCEFEGIPFLFVTVFNH
jgi:hypothetical protein